MPLLPIAPHRRSNYLLSTSLPLIFMTSLCSHRRNIAQRYRHHLCSRECRAGAHRSRRSRAMSDGQAAGQSSLISHISQSGSRLHLRKPDFKSCSYGKEMPNSTRGNSPDSFLNRHRPSRLLSCHRPVAHFIALSKSLKTPSRPSRMETPRSPGLVLSPTQWRR